MEREQQELLQKIAAAGTASGEYHRKAGVRRIADGFLPEGFVYATSILWQKVPE